MTVLELIRDHNYRIYEEYGHYPNKLYISMEVETELIKLSDLYNKNWAWSPGPCTVYGIPFEVKYNLKNILVVSYGHH